jgi:hypothetical protein
MASGTLYIKVCGGVYGQVLAKVVPVTPMVAASDLRGRSKIYAFITTPPPFLRDLAPYPKVARVLG